VILLAELEIKLTVDHAGHSAQPRPITIDFAFSTGTISCFQLLIQLPVAISWLVSPWDAMVVRLGLHGPGSRRLVWFQVAKKLTPQNSATPTQWASASIMLQDSTQAVLILSKFHQLAITNAQEIKMIIKRTSKRQLERAILLTIKPSKRISLTMDQSQVPLPFMRIS
jgi:hypothetical protein